MAAKKRLRQKATSTLKIRSESAEFTRKLGESIGTGLSPGTVVALTGNLGSGKTVLAQGILRGLGVKDRYMTSPSFVLVKQYKGRFPAYHIDLFRLKDKRELASLELKEFFFGNGAAIVEWAERAGELLPPEYLEIHLKFLPSNATARIISLSARGDKYRKYIENPFVKR